MLQRHLFALLYSVCGIAQQCSRLYGSHIDKFEAFCYWEGGGGLVAKKIEVDKSPRRGLLDQAQVRTPYTPPFWGSFAYDTPRYGTGCPTSCKIIILGEKMIPQ